MPEKVESITAEQFRAAQASRPKGRRTGGPIYRATMKMEVGEAIAIKHRCTSTANKNKCPGTASALYAARKAGRRISITHLGDGRLAILRIE